MKKHHLLHVAILLLLSLTQACEDQDQEIDPLQPNTEVLLLSENKHLQGVVDQITKSSINARSNDILKEVDFDKAMKRVNAETGITKYSFSMNSDNSLVMRKFILIEQAGQSILGFIYEYETDEKWLVEMEVFPGWHQYNGYFRILDLDGKVLVENEIVDGCTVDVETQNGRTSATVCITTTWEVCTYVKGQSGVYCYYETETSCTNVSGGGGTQIGGIPPEPTPLLPNVEDEPTPVICAKGLVKDENGDCIKFVGPCDTANNLEINSDFINKMKDLKSNTSLNYETGFVVHSPNNGNYQYDYIQGNSNDPQIGFSLQGKIDGYIHSHYGGTLSIFSGSDIRAIYQLYSNDNIRDVPSFFCGVVTSQGTTYLLMIDDVGLFNNFGNQYLSDDESFQLFENTFSLLFNISVNNSILNNENSLLNMLESMNSGLKLFKGDYNNYSSWNPKGVDTNGATINSDCN